MSSSSQTVESTHLNNTIYFLIKLSVSLLIVLWLFFNNKLDMVYLSHAISNLNCLLVFFLLSGIQLVLASLRTCYLMLLEDKPPTYYKKVFNISWAVLFVNCLAPSALLSELVKIKELMNIKANINKDYAFYAAIYAKVFSTLALVIIVAAAYVVSSQIPYELSIIGYYSVLFVMTLIGFFYYKSAIYNVIKKNVNDSFMGLKLSGRIDKKLKSYRDYNFKIFNNTLFLKSIMVSIAVQLLNIFSIMYIVYYTNSSLQVSFVNLAGLISMGIFVSTIPVTYLGLGIGNLAFQGLLSTVAINNGSDIFMVYFMYSYFFNLFGIIPFTIIIKNKTKNAK